MNTKIYYLYRDASNYKVQNSCVVEGEFSGDDVKRICDSLQEGEFFIPEMIGFDVERFSEWTEDDHDWCELDSDSFELTEEEPTVFNEFSIRMPVTIHEVVLRFESAARDRWKM